MTVDLERLRLTEESVQRRLDFLEGYWQHITEAVSQPEEDRKQGVLAWESASVCAEIAQLQLLLFPRDAHPGMRLAGQEFEKLDHPFGTYLSAVGDSAGSGADTMSRIRSEVNQLKRGSPQHESEPRSARVMPAQQDAYSFVSSSALLGSLSSIGTSNGKMEYGADFYEEQLLEIAQESTHRVGVTPVGALGTPMYRFWAHGRALLGVDPPEVLATHLAAMCRSYSEVIEQAQVNTYLWENLASPVDLGDLDIIGIATLAMRRFGVRSFEDTLVEQDLGQISEVLIDAAAQFVGEDPAETREGRHFQ